MITEEQIKSLLEESKPSIIEGFKSEITKKISWDIVNLAQEEVSKSVVAWVKSEIIPEITKQLVESKDGLISLAPKLAEQLVSEMHLALAADFKKKMECSYSRSKVFEAMFK